MAPGYNIVAPPDGFANHTAALPSKTAEVTITEIPPSPPDTQIESNHGKLILLDPASVTQEFDALRFEAAAFAQLSLTGEPSPTTALGDTATVSGNEDAGITSDILISSPYNQPGHYLTLNTLPIPSQLFALALTALKPVREDYATASYTSALNFDTVLDVLRRLSSQSGHTWRETSFYVVIFRSKLKDGIDNDWLYKLDYESHREACESGGLLKYWFGKSNGERRNLATCFWHSRQDAYNGGLGPWHRKARAAGRQLYESIVFSTHRFTILDGIEGFKFEEWKE